MRSVNYLLCKTKFTLSRCFAVPHFSTQPKTVVPGEAGLKQKTTVDFTDEYATGVLSGEFTRDPVTLARFLASRIVAFGRHFIVLDKPCNLSVWGHAKSASAHFTKTASLTTPLSLLECLPHLCAVLAEEESVFTALLAENLGGDRILSALVDDNTQSSRQDLWRPPSEIFIAESLPATYSGLILLATSSAYADFARVFYANAVRNCFLGSMYQAFHVVCWGHPSREHVKDERFPMAIHKASDSISVAYRPTDDKLSGAAHKKGKIMYKHVGHRILSRGSGRNSGCLVEITCNSCYAGLVEVYLLHEGCEVVGEDLQASRLVITSGVPMILPPTSARLGAPLPKELVKLLGGGKLPRANVPTHVHRSELLIPPPLPRGPEENAFYKRVKAPMGKIVNTHESRPVLSWKPFHVSAKKDIYFLSAKSPFLPSHFTRTLERLDLKPIDSVNITESAHDQ